MGYSRQEPDVEGDRTLECVLAFNLLLGNICHHVQVGKGSHADSFDPFPTDHAQTCHRCKSDPWRGNSPAISASCMRYEDYCSTKIQAQVHP